MMRLKKSCRLNDESAKVDIEIHSLPIPINTISIIRSHTESLSGFYAVACRFMVDLDTQWVNQLNTIEFVRVNTEEADTTWNSQFMRVTTKSLIVWFSVPSIQTLKHVPIIILNHAKLIWAIVNQYWCKVKKKKRRRRKSDQNKT